MPVTSSAMGLTTMPCRDASTSSSTKSRARRNPRTGPRPVSTRRRSPTSRSCSSCSLPGCGKGTTRLARSCPTIARVIVSGWLGVVTVSAMVTVQAGPSRSTLISRGRRKRTRTTAAPSSLRETVALRMAPPESAESLPRSILAGLSNTIHSVSSRRNTAAGVGTANGNSISSVWPSRWRPATTGAFGLGAGVCAAASCFAAVWCGALSADSLLAGACDDAFADRDAIGSSGLGDGGAGARAARAGDAACRLSWCTPSGLTASGLAIAGWAIGGLALASFMAGFMVGLTAGGELVAA